MKRYKFGMTPSCKFKGPFGMAHGAARGLFCCSTIQTPTKQNRRYSISKKIEGILGISLFSIMS
jgi:hypothetical protein